MSNLRAPTTQFNVTPTKSPNIFERATPVRKSLGYANKEKSVCTADLNEIFGAPSVAI